MSNIMIPTIQMHYCQKCNNIHEYVIDQSFLKTLKTNLKVRCSVCGEIRRQICSGEKEYLKCKMK